MNIHHSPIHCTALYMVLMTWHSQLDIQTMYECRFDECMPCQCNEGECFTVEFNFLQYIEVHCCAILFPIDCSVVQCFLHLLVVQCSASYSAVFFAEWSWFREYTGGRQAMPSCVIVHSNHQTHSFSSSFEFLPFVKQTSVLPFQQQPWRQPLRCWFQALPA